MGTYTAEKTFNFEFDGDQVNYTIKSPSVKLMKELAPFMSRGEDGKMGLVETVDVMINFGDALRDNVTQLSGLTDANGVPINMEVVTSEMFFLRLVMQIITDMFSMGGMDKVDEKKSEVISVTSSTEVNVEQIGGIPFLESAG